MESCGGLGDGPASGRRPIRRDIRQRQRQVAEHADIRIRNDGTFQMTREFLERRNVEVDRPGMVLVGSA